MASQRLYLRLVELTALLTLLALADVSSESSLHKILKKRDVVGDGSASPKYRVAVAPAKAKEFLAKLQRPKRNIWDRSRPDVQQWIMQFMYMGFDETRLEADLSYWMDHALSSDQGRQHHYDENSPIAPRDRGAHRHRADVNYDYY
ncbi:augurin-A [Oncorhynchus tshawytscha]|uniref:Esophageal cancer-related gene 4 protein n=1 Tax=Oncorhynchus tshawytscha TaxID=74940 RepID=A0A8C8ET08_ONCTS|nr:augurin-A [Oncorhynchus tshawytscha]XP_042175824.1 augurin-A [Oncorhynchus tshawytscha]